MSSRARRARLAAIALGAGLSLAPAPALAQEAPRTAVVIDYVGVEGIYLPVGTEQGVQVGDTLDVFLADTASTPVGRVAFTAASRSRSVVMAVEPGFAVARGDSIFMPLPGVAAEIEEEPLAAAVVAAAPAAVAPAVQAQRSGPRVSGRIALDVEARETRTSFQNEDLFGTTRRRFATPVTSMSLRVSDLPGGLRLEMNGRASYRYSDVAAIEPTTSVRIYNLAVAKDFEGAPVQVRAGRFYNPYEAYSAYWDGALLRVGGRRGGIGVVAGFEPERSNEQFSPDIPKVTGFADFSVRRGSLRYSTDLSFHVVRPKVEGLLDQSFAGWTQRVSAGPVSVNQRLRVDRDPSTGKWTLGQLRVRGGLDLVGPLHLNVGFARTRPAILRGAPAELSPERDEVTGGLSVFTGNHAVSFDVGALQWEGEGRGLSLSAAASTRLGAVSLFASGRHWSRDDMTSISAAPGFGFDIGWVNTRLGYQFYRTESIDTLVSQAANIELTGRFSSRYWVTLRADQQWGDQLEGTRLRLSIGRSF